MVAQNAISCCMRATSWLLQHPKPALLPVPLHLHQDSPILVSTPLDPPQFGNGNVGHAKKSRVLETVEVAGLGGIGGHRVTEGGHSFREREAAAMRSRLFFLLHGSNEHRIGRGRGTCGYCAH